VQLVQAREIEVTAIHNIERACFEAELVQNVDLVNLAMCNDHNSWDVAAQIEQRVQFHRSFVLAKLSPREKCQTQIDGAGIECVNSLGQFDAEAVVRVEYPGAGNQHLRKVGVDAPIAHRVRMGQSVARDLAANAEMIELALLRAQASFDIAQTLPIGELREGHAKKLIPARKGLEFVVALITFDTTSKSFEGRKSISCAKIDLPEFINPPLPQKLRKHRLDWF